jgi:hypothetical protein
MTKKKDKPDKGLIKKEADAALQQVMSHPVFQDMSNRLKTVQGMLKDLPNVIGAAVAESLRKPPEGASGPPMPLLSPTTIEIHRNKLVVDGKTTTLKDMPVKSTERQIEKIQLNAGWSVSQQPKSQCDKCHGSGVWETGNNDIPCSCPAGKKALFNVAGIEGIVTGEEMERHLLNDSPEPLSSADFNALRKKPR